LVLGMMVVGCSNGTTDNGDTWSKVTDMSKLNGNWKVSVTHNMTMTEWWRSNHMEYPSSGSVEGDTSGNGITSIDFTFNINQFQVFYYIGQSFNPTGFEVTVHYSGRTETISPGNLSLDNENFSATAGEKVINIEYQGLYIAEIKGVLVIDPLDQQTVTFINNVSAAYKATSLFTFNMNTKQILFTGESSYLFSGVNINDPVVWGNFKQKFLNWDPGEVYDSGRSMTRTYNYEQTLTDEEFQETFSLVQINQDGTKLKIPPEVMQIFGDLETETTIAIKQ